jgi:hypothetical protein
MDRAYDSNAVRKDWADCSIEPIVPARKKQPVCYASGRTQTAAL